MRISNFKYFGGNLHPQRRSMVGMRGFCLLCLDLHAGMSTLIFSSAPFIFILLHMMQFSKFILELRPIFANIARMVCNALRHMHIY